MKKLLCLVLLFCAAFLFAAQKITLGSLFQDGAVFQRNTDIPVWGKTLPGRSLLAEFAGQKIRTKSNAAGEFMFRFSPVRAGGPYVLTITDKDSKAVVTVKDILVGEVWVASGQSNMEYQIGSDWAFPAKFRNDPNSLARRQQREYIAGIKNPGKLRYFYVPHNCTGVRESTVPGTWKYVDAKSAPGFSAAAAWFAKAVQENLNVPVGVIVTAWGGTRVEAWTSREALLTNPETAAMAKEADRALQDPGLWDAAARRKNAQKNLKRDPGNKGFGMGYAKVDLNDSGWKDMVVPGSWIVQKISGNGAVWVRKTVMIPASWAGKDLILRTGGIDKMDISYFNGVEIGRTGKGLDFKSWDQKRTYTIPGKLVKAGKNVIAIRAYSFLHDGSLNGRTEDYSLSLKGSTVGSIKLAGMWKAKSEVDYGILSPRSAGYNPEYPNTPGILFDGMINPLLPYAIRGVIWYQGCSNAGNVHNAKAYQQRLVTMIRDWRFRWGVGDFPFIQVQLAYFDRLQEGVFLRNSPWAYLRESQRLVCESLPNVFMASVIDNGDKLDIHPQDKKTVGLRLAANALHNVYLKQSVIPCGPLYQSYRVEGNRIRITFRHGDGLKVKGDFRKSFYIGNDLGAFFPADTLTIEGNSLVLSSKSVAVPAAVRYAWSQAPESCLYNSADLPASSFRTDNWDSSR
ncbi:MAG: hypothetical protein IJW23_04230 [Lentisphaeria bacterium]|nr:hypothetical protein [Lentisphaeria bacterium]